MTLVRIPFPANRSTLLPPVGLWSMRSNPGLWDVEVYDAALFSPKDITTDAAGYSLSFAVQEPFYAPVRERTTAQVHYIGGPYGCFMNVDALPVVGDGESFLAGKHLQFHELNYPTFTEEEMLPYWQGSDPFDVGVRGRWYPLETSRGCPQACAFCASRRFWSGWQSRTLEQIAEQLSYLSVAHGVRELIIIDDNISLKKDRFIALLSEFTKRGFSWHAPNGIYARTLLDEDVLRAIDASNCKSIAIPFETASPRTAALMNLKEKFLSREESFFLVRRLNFMKIRTRGFFIILYPDELPEDVEATLALAQALPLKGKHIHTAYPIPGTSMHRLCVEKGYLRGDLFDAGYSTSMINTPFINRGQMSTFITQAMEVRREGKEEDEK